MKQRRNYTRLRDRLNQRISKEKMTLSADDLSNVVEKYQPITRYTIGVNERHIMFNLENDKEITKI